MAYDYIDSLSNEARLRYELKLAVVGLDDCPYRLPADSWTDDPTQWPDFEFGNLYVYLTSAAGVFTHQAMKAYKSLEAHRYFTAGFVQTVRHLKTCTSATILQASVRPSQRANDPSHQPWVAIHDGGEVLAAQCTCMAGLGESCSHVAAMLFKIEAAVRLGFTSLACTSRPCEWNNFFTEKVQTAPIKDIKFYRGEAVTKVVGTGRKRRPTSELPDPTNEEKSAFLQSLCTSLDHLPVALSLFRETSLNFKAKRMIAPRISLPRPLRSYYRPENKTLPRSELQVKCDELVSNTIVSAAEVDYVEQQTRAQSNSVVWHEQRAGHITASFANSVLHTKADLPAPSVVKGVTMIHPKPIMTPSLKYGRDKEPVAFKMYEESLPQRHINGRVRTTGMRMDLSRPWLSASADGVLECDCHGLSVLEIKCPYTSRNTNPQDLIKAADSYIYQGELKWGHKYYTQVQLQMEVYGVENCDFVVYAQDSILCIHVDKDAEYLSSTLPKLEVFWGQHIVPELLTRALENNDKENTPPPLDDKLYCYCQEKWDGESVLVGCDGVACPFEWVHLRCIRPRRKTVPKGSWYCKHCRAIKAN